MKTIMCRHSYPIGPAVLRWLESILSERFGHIWLLDLTAEGLAVMLPGQQGRIIFDKLQDCFTQARSDAPCSHWDVAHEGWSPVIPQTLPAPGVAHLPQPLIEQHGCDHVIHYDILGLTYWMLARVEEIGRTDIDHHERFPATSSHAFKYNYLDRPVVDEWLHILGQVIQRQWPGLVLSRPAPKIFVTCDVDNPFAYDGSLRRLPRLLASDILKRQSFAAAVQSLCNTVNSWRGELVADPFLKNIDWMMDVNERAGNRVAFYFITGGVHPVDASYRMHQPAIRQLLRHIHDRGHEIGLHPSYMTYNDPQQTHREADTLRQTLEDEGIPADVLGGRQHFLRWQTAQTARNWDAAGMTYDTTLSYADRAGFRCGTSREFTMFDAERAQPLHLKQRPLVLMDCSVVADRYMAMGYTDDALRYMRTLKARALAAGSEFTLLWHNSYFPVQAAYRFYEDLIQSNT